MRNLLAGAGSPGKVLSEKEVRDLCEEAFSTWDAAGKRVLALIPDSTRTVPMDRMFRIVCGLLAGRVKQLDFMIALGTHPPMTEEAVCQRVGITPQEKKDRYAGVRFFNHQWDDPGQLGHLGVLPEEEIERISDGLIREKIHVTVNRSVFDYDTLMVIGPTFPHEVVGFSGGNKYFFPGISGPEIIDAFHWLGALITCPSIIGKKDTPVRDVVNRASSLLPMEKLCLSLVVKGDGLAGIYIGTPEQAFSAAADLSARLHIVEKDRPFQRVLSCAPSMYDDLWTGGKCMYKLEQVVADGGELIIYAPHITEVSKVHGALIEKAGYHVRDYFVERMERFQDVPRGVLAHCTHVKGVGTCENGEESARIQVTLATGIPREVCARINLGYLDPASITMDAWMDREDEGLLCVPKAGEMLYRLRGR